MEYIKIRGIDLPCSRIGLGTAAMGGWRWGGSDPQESIRTLAAAVERGINFIDTAPIYGGGLSEALIGLAFGKPRLRQRVVIASKVGLLPGKRGPVIDCSPRRISAELKKTLGRLKTDYLDLYQVHWPDDSTPIEKTAEALLRLWERKVIRAIGVSNFSVVQIRRFMKVAPLHAVQLHYNIYDGQAESGLLPFCRRHSIPTIVYEALCKGLLTGRMRPNTTFAEHDSRASEPRFTLPLYPRYLRSVHALDALARKRYRRRVLHLAVRWVMDQDGVGIALWGARRPEQMKAVSKCLGWKLSQAQRKSVLRHALRWF
jgi:aryl-alcohol dehydrogenase-like predicted oxidoreductase